MKKLMIIFAGAALALSSCKQQSDGLASAGVDDVYYNPKKDWKPNVAPQAEQYDAAPQNPNAGKIAAKPGDENNPYYKDPNFNYDDYYDNAYAARIRRFNNPIYGTGYYDSYNTNAYYYNGNPSSYGTSIYSSYNMGYGSNYGYGGGYNNGYGYYSPSNSFWNAYYNPYYSNYGYGSGYGMSYGMGYGYGSYGYGGYNPYGMYNSGYGCGGYNPYSSYGYGYNGYGYNPYGYGYYNSPMTYGGYYNSYDYNSNSYSHYGPRGSHSGGNSSTTSPVPTPHHLEVKNNGLDAPNNGVSPYSIDRFNHVELPKEHFAHIIESKNPVSSPLMMNPGGGSPINGGGNNTVNSNPYGVQSVNNGGSTGRPIYNNNSTTSSPSYNNNQSTSQPAESKPRRFNWGGGDGGSNSNTNSNNNSINNSWTPHMGGSTPAGGSGGGTNYGGSSGGGMVRPRK